MSINTKAPEGTVETVECVTHLKHSLSTPEGIAELFHHRLCEVRDNLDELEEPLEGEPIQLSEEQQELINRLDEAIRSVKDIMGWTYPV